VGASNTFGRARRATGAAPRIGVDLGGTKIEAIALGEGNAELFRQRSPTPDSYEETLRSIAALVTAAETGTGPAASVGVGAPGSLSPVSGKWRNANLEFCNGRDLPGDLAASLGRPVTVENDANCFALSEAIDGAGAGAWSVYGLTAGTGLGGGMVVGGILNRGRNASAGEAGHNPLPWLRAEDYPLPPCYCGLEGCVEQYLSGTGVSRDFLARTGNALSADRIIAMAAAGEADAMEAVERLQDRFARFLSVIVNLFDPDVIVLGGGLSRTPDFCESIAPRVPRYTFARDLKVAFVPALYGDASGVRGAAMLSATPLPERS